MIDHCITYISLGHTHKKSSTMTFTITALKPVKKRKMQCFPSMLNETPCGPAATQVENGSTF